ELLEVVDRPHRAEAGRVTMALGTFAAGEEKTALLRVRVAPGASVVADVRLAYRDLVGDRDAAAEGVLAVRFDPAAADRAPVDPLVDARLGRKDTFDALIEANAAFASGDIAGAVQKLTHARTSVSARKRNSGGAKPTVDADFDRQLQAIAEASSGFDEAARAAPVAKPAATKTGKRITRQNASAADPFSD
ncbi:MAG TPA: hypothetical protein VFG69_03870, partial [Nannocystaceae bacterium]|nr:hypothetical protein [Nannocystaceae bacterium]